MDRIRYDNRELSWLKFNKRVLEEGMDERVPLLERLGFISIFQSNLDEFFMVRVGSLYEQMRDTPNKRDGKSNMTAEEQLEEIIDYTRNMCSLKDYTYNNIMEEVKEQGIELIDFHTMRKNAIKNGNTENHLGKKINPESSRLLTADDEKYLKKIFENRIRPLISPQIIGKRQPFPFLKNKHIYAIVSLESRSGNEKLGIVPCSGEAFSRLLAIPSQTSKYILAEEVILHFVSEIFSNYKVKSKSLIRITRSADIDEETMHEEGLDYRSTMKKLIKKRRKLDPVRMEMSRGLNSSALKMLCDYVGIFEQYIFYSNAPLDVSFTGEIRDMLRYKTDLFYENRIPQKTPEIVPRRSIIEQIEEKDKLLFYPYNSIKPFLDMLYEASEDPTVVSIKMTLYRLASNSKIVEALTNAVENGKEVIVLVELRARFDEENNINWSRILEKVGCRVIYGLPGLKVHSKLCIITRMTDNGIKYITQIGTGNYNEKTAGIYTDYCLMTASTKLAHEANEIFDKLLLGEVIEETEHFLVSPLCLRDKIFNMIDDEIEKSNNGEKAFVAAKINSLADKGLINKIAEASKAGVEVQLIVRGICCLIPGIYGETDNVEVKSIVGRYLEHTRVYIFGAGKDCRVYISSADYMSRNTRRRVEVAAPIYDEDIKNRIIQDFSIRFNDNVKARKLLPTGEYVRVETAGEPLSAQDYFFNRAYAEAHGQTMEIPEVVKLELEERSKPESRYVMPEDIYEDSSKEESSEDDKLDTGDDFFKDIEKIIEECRKLNRKIKQVPEK